MPAHAPRLQELPSSEAPGWSIPPRIVCINEFHSNVVVVVVVIVVVVLLKPFARKGRRPNLAGPQFCESKGHSNRGHVPSKPLGA